MSRVVRDSNAYVELVEALPEPTQEQAREFAGFVTGAHSWYKHLPQHKDVPFVFFLDPNAGRELVHAASGELTYLDRKDESRRFHYTWMTTEEYRRRFGHWTYHARQAPGFMYRDRDGLADATGLGPRILSPGSGVLNLPPELVRAGTAMLNALMFRQHRAQMEEARDRTLSDFLHEERIRQLFARVMPTRGATRRREMRDPERAALRYPSPLAEALRPLFALWSDPVYLGELEAAWRELDEFYDSVTARRAAFRVEEERRLLCQAEGAWEDTASRRQERVLQGALIAALNRERCRQMGEMVAAMERFLNALRRAPKGPMHLH